MITKAFWGYFLVIFFFFPDHGESQSLKGLKIYINPGHGGFDSDDRNVPLPSFSAGDTAGFWESKSNLVKGLYLKKLLESEGAKVIISRVQNRTADDRPLSAIAEEANANQADFMISIHSNAFNSVTNYVLELFHGWDNNPILPQSMSLASLFWENLISNQVSHWTYQNRNVRGDKSFAPASWNGYGVLRPLMVPGLISEGSFHDYIPETYRLLNNDYKQLEAWHIFRAFCQFYGGNPGNKGKIAGFVKDSGKKVSGYSYAPDSKDQWLPVNGSSVMLQPGNSVYQVDNLNNGFFIFDNLNKGNYRLQINADQYIPVLSDSIRVDSSKVSYFLCYLTRDPAAATSDRQTPGQERSISFYPNPAKDFIHVILQVTEGSYPYRITCISGNSTQNGEVTISGGKGMIKMSGLKAGTYFLSIYLPSEIIHGLFIAG